MSLFRLNLSHTKVDDLPRIIEYIQERTDVAICLDTEGAQVRTGDITGGEITVQENTTVTVCRECVAGDAVRFNLYPDYVIDELVVGDLIRVDADVLIRIVGIEDDCVVARVLNGGAIGRSKAVTVLDREISMPPLTDKDTRALEIGKQMGVTHVALSFANRASDVEIVREASIEGATVISKIECLNGLLNLPEITDRSDALLIDRGDLSRQVNLEKIPALQKDIIRYGRDAGKRVYVATNLMESMVTAPMPTRAEVNDVFNTLMDGADGLVLAAESAVGKYPVEAAIMVSKLIREYEHTSRWREISHATTPLSPLVEPHGGTLVDCDGTARQAGATPPTRSLELRPAELLDCVQIAHGAYSPLNGFMGSAELDRVLRDGRLLGGLAWTMPILLQVHEPVAAEIGLGERVALTDGAGKVYATIDVSEIYALELEDLATKWFGTSSSAHPGVGSLYERGNRAVAGQITLVDEFASAYPDYELTPTQARLVFAQKGWTKVVGAPVRGVPEGRAESPELRALEEVRGDGLYLGPVVGPTKKDDFFEDLMLKSYQLLLTSESYPKGKVILGAVSSYPRHCPEREAIFDAIRFKNLGCSHFIVPSYQSSEAGAPDLDLHRVFEAIDDLGIVPVHAHAATSAAASGRARTTTLAAVS